MNKKLLTLEVGGEQQAGDIVYNAADQTTSIKIGTATANQVTESYTYDSQTGLLTNQKVERGGLNLLDLSYDYNRNNSVGNLSGKTGHLTKIIDNLNPNKNREYKFDALGRLTQAKGGTNGMWTQSYSYDRYGNRTNVTATGVAVGGSPIPVDGTPNLTYEATDNRINTSGYLYDKAGNQTKALNKDGTWLKFEYDAANRLQIVKRDSDGAYLQAFQYGSTNVRLMDMDYGFGYLKIFASVGGTTLAEYTEFVGAVPTWTKSYNYLGDSVLSTISNVNNSEVTEFNHPDRLGTRVVTNQTAGTSSEQTTLPFGTALNAESTTSLGKRFTSYERSNQTGLDYAVNRTYDSKQGRFTQVDPIGMSASSLLSPQTLNLYTYCGNDPINHTDPSGLFFGKLFKWISKAFKWIMVAVMVATAILTVVGTFLTPVAFAAFLKTGLGQVLGFMAGLPSTIGNILSGVSKSIAGIFSFTAERASALVGWGALMAGASVGAIANSFAQKQTAEKKRWAIVVQTVTRVISRLKMNSKCLKTINHDGYDLSPPDAIKEILDRGNLPYENMDVAARTGPNQTNDGVIELGPSFFKKTIKDGRGNDWNKITGLNEYKTREFIILHELRHLFGSNHSGEGGIERDVAEILKDCFGVKPNIPKGGIK